MLCAGLRVVIIGGRIGRQSGLGPITLGMAETVDSSRRYGVCPKKTCTWASSGKPRSRADSTPTGRTVTALLLQMCQSNTVVKCRFSSRSHRGFQWRPSISLDPKSSASRWRRESGDGTSLDVTSNPTTH